MQSRIAKGWWLLWWCGWFLPAVGAVNQVQLLETFPAAGTVAVHQTIYLHLRYQADAATALWAQPYYNGKSVTAVVDASPLHEEKTEEALVGFALQDADTQTDEVRILAGKRGSTAVSEVASFPLHFVADAKLATQVSPDWVLALRSAAADLASTEPALELPGSRSQPRGVDWDAWMLALVFFGSLAATLIWPLVQAWLWRGVWRVLAFGPALFMGFVLVKLVVDVTRDPSSHNLWPFELIVMGFVSVCLTAGLILLKRVIEHMQRND